MAIQQLGIGLTGPTTYRAECDYDTEDDTVVLTWRGINNTEEAATFTFCSGDPDDPTVHFVLSDIGPESQDEMSAENHSGTIMWNEGEEHRDGYHSVFFSVDLVNEAFVLIS